MTALCGSVYPPRIDPDSAVIVLQFTIGGLLRRARTVDVIVHGHIHTVLIGFAKDKAGVLQLVTLGSENHSVDIGGKKHHQQGDHHCHDNPETQLYPHLGNHIVVHGIAFLDLSLLLRGAKLGTRQSRQTHESIVHTLQVAYALVDIAMQAFCQHLVQVNADPVYIEELIFPQA